MRKERVPQAQRMACAKVEGGYEGAPQGSGGWLRGFQKEMTQHGAGGPGPAQEVRTVGSPGRVLNKDSMAIFVF